MDRSRRNIANRKRTGWFWFHGQVIPIFVILLYSSCSSTKNTSKIVPVQQVKSDSEVSYVLQEANKSYLFGNYKQAYNLYLACLKEDSLNAVASYQLANIEASAKKMDKAITYSEIACNSDSNNIWYKYQLAALYKENNDYDKLIPIQKQIVELQPERDDLKFELALLYYDKKEYQKALDMLDQLQNQFGLVSNVVLTKAKIYNSLEKNVEAEQLLINYLAVDSTDLASKILLLQVYQDTRNEVKGDSLANILMTEKQSKSLVSSLIHYYQSLNSNAKLISYFRTAYKNKYLHDEEIISYISALYSDEKFSVEKDYNLIDSLSTIIIFNPTSYLLLADLNIKAKKFSLAADCVMKYISIEPNLNFKLYEQLLILLNSSKRYNELDSISTIAIQKFPYEATPFIFKGLSAFNTQKYRNAAVLMIDKFSILNKASSEEKNTIYEFIADLSYKAGMKDTSYLYYNKLIESNSASLIIKNNYAYYLALDSVNLDFADSLSLITVKNDPKNSTFLDTYAWIMYKKGDLKKAKFYIDKAIKYSSPSKALYEHARDIYRELNLLDKAKYFQLKSDETTAE